MTLLFGSHPRVGKQSSVRRMYGSHLLEPKVFGIIFAFCLEFKYFEEDWQESIDEDIERQLEQEGKTKHTSTHNKIPTASADDADPRMIPWVTPATIRCDTDTNWWENKYPTAFDSEKENCHESEKTCTRLFVHVTFEPNPLKALQFLVRMKRLPYWVLFIAWRDFQRDDIGVGTQKSLFIPQQYAGGVHVLLFWDAKDFALCSYEHSLPRGDTCHHHATFTSRIIISEGCIFAKFNHCDVQNIEHIIFYPSQDAEFERALRYVHLFKTITFVVHDTIFEAMKQKLQPICDPNMFCDNMQYLNGTAYVLDIFLRTIHSGSRYSRFKNIHCRGCKYFPERCDIYQFMSADCYQQILALQKHIDDKLALYCQDG